MNAPPRRAGSTAATHALLVALLLLLPRALPGTEPARGAPAGGPQAGRSARIELLNLLWQFNASHRAQSTLTAQTSQAEFAAPADATRGFTVKMTVALNKFDGTRTILEMPGVLRVCLRQHDPADRKRQNYPAFKMADGSVPVLEANVGLHSAEHPDWKDMTVGIPLAMLASPGGEHEVVLHFSGVRWSMYVDGRLLDNDFPFGYPQWAARNTWTMDAQYVKQAALYLPALAPEKRPAAALVAPVQYWTPPGHNCWVGDVVTLFHAGRYHIFYLYDRRHHASKFGKGAHYFEHLSTTDFRTWTEHEAAVPLDEQWECVGTGTPFVFQGKFYLAYGLHTGRIYPPEKTTWPAQWDYLKKNGRAGEFRRAATPGVPAGSTYSISPDGLANFAKSQVMFHPCQNPSVYIDPHGRLRMLANAGSKGIWESDSVAGGWRCLRADFPPGGDCTFFFRWGQFDYIIGGFKGLWSKPAAAPDTAYEDVVAQGLDFYDGVAVPAISEIAGGRFLMAGWIEIRGWGGPLILRELVQLPGGRIGAKWMPEVTPETDQPRTLAARIAETAALSSDDRSFLLEFDVHPTAARPGRCGVAFLPAQGEQGANELQLRLDEQRAQYGPGSAQGFAPKQKSLREGGSARAIENLVGVDRPFTVRVVGKSDDKLGGTLFDAEIGGTRTLLTYRPDLTVKRLVFRCEGVEVRNVRIARLKQ